MNVKFEQFQTLSYGVFAPTKKFGVKLRDNGLFIAALFGSRYWVYMYYKALKICMTILCKKILKNKVRTQKSLHCIFRYLFEGFSKIYHGTEMKISKSSIIHQFPRSA